MRTITIGKEKLPFRLSYRSLKGALRESGLTVTTMDSLGLEQISIFATHAINAGYRFEKSDKTITVEGVEDLLDEDFAGINKISDAIAKEMEVLSEPQETDENEKK